MHVLASSKAIYVSLTLIDNYTTTVPSRDLARFYLRENTVFSEKQWSPQN